MRRTRVGLIADTHIPEAGPALWPQVFHAFRNVDAILHAGDVHDPSVLEALGRLAPVWAVRGNGDDGGGGRAPQPSHPTWREAWLLQIGGVRVGVLHCLPIPELPPRFTVQRAMRRAFADASVDVLVYGDTHVEAIDHIGGVLCVNPGSPTLPHNLNPQLGTIGFLEIVGEDVNASIWQLTDDDPGVAPYDWKRWRR